MRTSQQYTVHPAFTEIPGASGPHGIPCRRAISARKEWTRPCAMKASSPSRRCSWRPRRWSDRTKLVESPLFPGYTFVRMEAEPDLLIRVLRLPGVVRFVTSWA